MTSTLKLLALLSILSSTAALPACGKKDVKGGGAPAKVGAVEAAFLAQAHATGVPARFLMATAYLESRLTPDQASAHYVSTNGDGAAVSRGTLMTETAFGLTYDVLGLDGTKPQSHTLEVQIEAYARYVAAKVKDLNLAAAPAGDQDKYYWIENLANIQRSGYSHPDQAERRNIRVIFARELINVLNTGFVWQDIKGEKVELTPESPKLEVAHFPTNGKAWFTLDLAGSEIRTPNYVYMGLTSLPNPSNLTNHPVKVIVVHCPLSLSACLELQDGSADNDNYVHLAAHYIVMSERGNDEELDRLAAIQVATHEDVVILTDKLGVHQPIDNAIVVMLTGESGRIVDGQRAPALPTWFNDRQLRNMGQVINDICARLAQTDPEHVSLDKCLSTSTDAGVQFRNQDKAEEYRWGDIPDFDPTIFKAYVVNFRGLGTEVSFNFPGDMKRFSKDEAIPLRLSFNATVKSISLEHLVRCENGQVAWETIVNQPITRGETKYSFDDKSPYAGPNNNGEQFYRARVFGKDGKLIGWNIDRVVMSSFDKNSVAVPNSTCATAD